MGSKAKCGGERGSRGVRLREHQKTPRTEHPGPTLPLLYSPAGTQGAGGGTWRDAPQSQRLPELSAWVGRPRLGRTAAPWRAAARRTPPGAVSGALSPAGVPTACTHSCQSRPCGSVSGPLRRFWQVGLCSAAWGGRNPPHLPPPPPPPAPLSARNFGAGKWDGNTWKRRQVCWGTGGGREGRPAMKSQSTGRRGVWQG